MLYQYAYTDAKSGGNLITNLTSNSNKNNEYKLKYQIK